MEKIFYALMILLLLMLQSGIAQNPASFRSRALGGIIDDDLDLVYDPIELSFVKGTRVYTNLSNLTSSNEQILNGQSDKEFLIGISSENPFVKSLWTSVLARFSNAQNSNNVEIDSDLNGWSDVYGRGTLESKYTAFIDNNGDGDYDIKKIVNQKKSDIDLNKNRSIILNNAYDMNDMILGFKFVYGSVYQEGTDASRDLGSGEGVLSRVSAGDADFSRYVSNKQIIQDFTDMEWSEKGDFKTDFNSDYFNIATSALLKNFKNYEARADLVFNHHNILSEVNDKYYGKYEYFNFNAANYQNNYSETASYNSQNEEKGSGIFLGGSLRKTFDKKEQRKDDGFWRAGIGLFLGFYDYANSNANRFNNLRKNIQDNPYSDYTQETINYNTITDNGDKSYQNYSTYIKINYPLGERVYLGLGGFFNYASTSRETDYIKTNSKKTIYTSINNQSGFDDYTRVLTSGLKAKRNYEESSIMLQVPVGVEYRFTENKKWALRFGSIFYYTDQTQTDKKNIIKADPYTEKISRGDGSSHTTVNNNVYTSTKTEIKSTISNTVFSYGLGYNPTENLQIDLLGFLGNSNNSLLDSDFYRSLRFSFTFKF